jgi:hypothetical protein
MYLRVQPLNPALQGTQSGGNWGPSDVTLVQKPATAPLLSLLYYVYTVRDQASHQLLGRYSDLAVGLCDSPTLAESEGLLWGGQISLTLVGAVFSP